MLSPSLAQFRAVYCSGAFIPDADAVVALSLLFEKVHLPNNIEFVRSFVTKYRLVPRSGKESIGSVTVRSAEGEDPFLDLAPRQQETAKYYLAWAFEFAYSHAELFGEVFESGLFPNNKIFDVRLVKVRIPMKVVSDSDLIPVTCSEVKAVVFGAKRRWRSYGA